MAYVTMRDGVDVFYRDTGTGRPIVFVPGWGCSTRYFDAQFDGLSGIGRVIAYDPRGQGESDKAATGLRMARHARDLFDFVEALDLRDVVLVGWSMGATIALQYLDLYGGHGIGRLCLVSGGPKLLSTGEWPHGFMDLAQAVAWRQSLEDDFHATVTGVIPQYAFGDLGRDRLAFLTAEALKTAPDAAAASWECILTDLRDVLPTIDVPTLAILGRHDVVVPIGNVEPLEAVPDIRIEIMEDSGHMPFIEEAERFNDVLRAFCSS